MSNHSICMCANFDCVKWIIEHTKWPIARHTIHIYHSRHPQKQWLRRKYYHANGYAKKCLTPPWNLCFMISSIQSQLISITATGLHSHFSVSYRVKTIRLYHIKQCTDMIRKCGKITDETGIWNGIIKLQHRCACVCVICVHAWRFAFGSISTLNSAYNGHGRSMNKRRVGGRPMGNMWEYSGELDKIMRKSVQ